MEKYFISYDVVKLGSSRSKKRHDIKKGIKLLSSSPCTFHITSCENLTNISSNDYVCLLNNVDCMGFPFTASLIVSFSGTFEGNGFVIKNIHIMNNNTSGRNEGGLMGTNSGTI